MCKPRLPVTGSTGSSSLPAVRWQWSRCALSMTTSTNHTPFPCARPSTPLLAIRQHLRYDLSIHQPQGLSMLVQGTPRHVIECIITGTLLPSAGLYCLCVLVPHAACLLLLRSCICPQFTAPASAPGTGQGRRRDACTYDSIASSTMVSCH